MTFKIFIIACINAYLFNKLLNYFIPIIKPKLKTIGLRWTYHLQAFFEVHFWQIEDIKRRDKKRKYIEIVEIEEVPQTISKKDVFYWEVTTLNIEQKEYQTKESKLLE